MRTRCEVFHLQILEEFFKNLELEAFNKKLAARMANDFAEQQEWEQRYQLYVAAHDQLRKLIRSLVRMIVAVFVSLRASLMKRLSSVRRQSPSDQFVDGMVASIPVPPTMKLV